MNVRTIVAIALLAPAAACTTGRNGEPGKETEAGAAAGTSIVRLLPESPDVRPWTPVNRRLFYDASTLSDFIDGAAETYLDYGFIRAVSQEYSSGRESVVCSVYEMRGAEAAFGIFSSLRSPRKRRLDVGDDGFRAEAQVGFWQARYYVTVETYTLRGIADHALETFARVIAGRIGVHSGPPPVMSRLPRRGLRSSTDRLLKGRSAADALAALARAPGESPEIAGATVLTGDYDTVRGSYRLLVVLAASPDLVDRVRALPSRVFTPSAGYVAVAADRAAHASVWMRQGRAFASQPIDGGVRLVVDATRWQDARTALVDGRGKKEALPFFP